MKEDTISWNRMERNGVEYNNIIHYIQMKLAEMRSWNKKKLNKDKMDGKGIK